jgi:hypothetical protein
MKSNDMSPLKQYRIAERELIEALSSVTGKDGPVHKLGDCPTAADLRRFAAGKCKQVQRDETLAHLSSCDRCINVMTEVRERRVLIRRASLVLAVAAVLAVAVWAMLGRSSSDSTAVATVDLRLISPTRGIDNNGAVAITAQRKAGHLRIILPIGGEGKYECQILRPEQRVPMLLTSGEAQLENHDVILYVPAELGKLKAGQYSLALRRESSEWVYYKFTLE